MIAVDIPEGNSVGSIEGSILGLDALQYRGFAACNIQSVQQRTNLLPNQRLNTVVSKNIFCPAIVQYLAIAIIRSRPDLLCISIPTWIATQKR